MTDALSDHSGASVDAELDDAGATRLFWLFAVCHCVLWVIVPTLTQSNAPIDTLEMLYWGHEWQLGYYKHPPLPAWLAEASVMLCGKAIWPTYVLSQLSVLACFWSAFQLGKACLGGRVALLGVLLLEASYYYNYTTPEFNNNVTSRAFWALTVLFLYRGAVQRSLWGWSFAGVCLGLGMLAKYDTAVLAATMLLFSIGHPAGRAAWKTSGPYLTLALSLAVFGPHVLWLVENDYPTISYFLRRSSSERSWIDHLRNPASFLAAQLGAVLPVCLCAWPMLGKSWKRRALTSSTELLNRDFLLTFCCGPIALIVLVGLLTGVRLRSMWGTALWTFSGIALVFFFEVRRDKTAVRRQVVLAGLLCSAMAIGLVVHDVMIPALRGKRSRVHFPGRDLAIAVDDLCRRELGASPPIVGGPWWTAANVAFYAEHRASVFADMDPAISPWLSDAAAKAVGAVVVWPATYEDPAWEADLRQRFPELEELDRITVPDRHALSESHVFRVALIRPAKDPSRSNGSGSHPSAKR